MFSKLSPFFIFKYKIFSLIQFILRQIGSYTYIYGPQIFLDDKDILIILQNFAPLSYLCFSDFLLYFIGKSWFSD